MQGRTSGVLDESVVNLIGDQLVVPLVDLEHLLEQHLLTEDSLLAAAALGDVPQRTGHPQRRALPVPDGLTTGANPTSPVTAQTVFFRNLEFLNVGRYGLFAYQYCCHKLLRWLVPFLLVVALLTNFVLALGSGFFVFVLLLHSGFYALAAYGLLKPEATEHTIVKIPLYFLTVNAAILVAWWKYFSGNRMVMWTPSQR